MDELTELTVNTNDLQDEGLNTETVDLDTSNMTTTTTDLSGSNLEVGIGGQSMVVDDALYHDAIITEAYPNDKMQAVQNNYLLDPTDEEAKAEMAVMQDCRKQAKSIADEVMEEINK